MGKNVRLATFRDPQKQRKGICECNPTHKILEKDLFSLVNALQAPVFHPHEHIYIHQTKKTIPARLPVPEKKIYGFVEFCFATFTVCPSPFFVINNPKSIVCTPCISILFLPVKMRGTKMTQSNQETGCDYDEAKH